MIKDYGPYQPYPFNATAWLHLRQVSNAIRRNQRARVMRHIKRLENSPDAVMAYIYANGLLTRLEEEICGYRASVETILELAHSLDRKWTRLTRRPLERFHEALLVVCYYVPPEQQVSQISGGSDIVIALALLIDHHGKVIDDYKENFKEMLRSNFSD